MTKEETIDEIAKTLFMKGVATEPAQTAAKALARAMSYRPAPLTIPRETAEILGMVDEEPQAPSTVWWASAIILEKGVDDEDRLVSDLGLLPTNYFSQDALPRQCELNHFIWCRVGTQGTGNLGWWAPGKPKTKEAKALRKWFQMQTKVPCYGGHWWEVMDDWGPQGMDEVADAVIRVRNAGGCYPQSCSDGYDIDPRLGRLTGPRMWDFVNACAPGPWPENRPWVTRRLRYRGRIQRDNEELQKALEGIEKVRYIPA